MAIQLDKQQQEAIEKLKSGSILHADVGTGKSRVAIGYYYLKICGGGIKINGIGEYAKMTSPRDLVIITTAKKRDGDEWDKELMDFCLERGCNKLQDVTVTIDSWNNIGKYKKAYGFCFIFDEQRLTGSGPWVKAFYDIARKNKWILLSATPGDKWEDYIPVFIANGFYRNKTEFTLRHLIIERYGSYPKVVGYREEGLLLKHKMAITVTMTLQKPAEKHVIDIVCDYDKEMYKTVWRNRWNPFDDEPIEETGKLFYLLRRVANDDDSRIVRVQSIFADNPRVIVFYSFTYELDRLREFFAGQSIPVGEWNGKMHSEIPDGETWAYLVQYSAGCEGWNCTETDCMIFYSQSYSYRQTFQAEGRIDRRNTRFKDLYYYKLRSNAPIDLAIRRALKQKKDFNIKTFTGK